MGWGAVVARASVVAAIALSLYWSLSSVWGFTIDDAGISYAYAKHLAEGLGPVAVVGGPFVEGYSNPLWVALLSLTHALGFELPRAAKWLGTALLVGALVAGSAYLRRLDRESSRWPGVFDLTFWGSVLACSQLVVWVVAGLENALFFLLTLLLPWLYVRERCEPARPPLSGACAFALSVTRPEGALYALCWLGLCALEAVFEPPRRHRALRALAWMLVPLAVYHLAHYLVFRQLLPNTYYAKPPKGGPEAGFEYLKDSLLETGLIWMLPPAAIGAVSKLRLKLPLIWNVLSGAAFVVYAGGDWMPHARFVSFFAPSLCLLATLGVKDLTALARRWLPHRVPPVALALAFSMPALASWFWLQQPKRERAFRKPWCHFCERQSDMRGVERIVRRAGLESITLLTHDFGGPAWASTDSLYPIDFLGLCDRNVALIRRTRHGSMSNDFRYYQYSFHEQPSPPSLIYVPPNFWRGFRASPEYRMGYLPLSPRLLGRHSRRDAYFGVHRSEFVDFFPPLEPLPFVPLSPDFAAAGFGVFAPGAREGPVAAKGGSRIEAHFSLVPMGRLRGGEELRLRISSSEGQAESESLQVAGGLDALAKRLGRGDALSLRFELELPPEGSEPYRVELGARRRNPRGSTKLYWSTLGSLEPGRELAPASRTFSRFPRALPRPRATELLELREPVADRVEARRRPGGQAARDPELAQRLSELGRELEARGEVDQAYLAWIWATSVDRRTLRDLADSLHRVRQVPLGEDYALEIVLLRHYYAVRSDAALARLVGFYASRSRAAEARYFLGRARTTPLAGPLATYAEALERGELSPSLLSVVAKDPLGGELAFEAPVLPSGSEGDRSVFDTGPWPEARRYEAGLRGFEGRGVLSSLGRGRRGRGVLRLPEFRVEGQVLSLLVGGGSKKQRVGVRLVADGRVVRTAHGANDGAFVPRFWDVSDLAGQTVRLEAFDSSSRSYVSLDQVLLWR